MIEEALAVLENGPASPRIEARALNDLGVILESLGDYETALALYERSLGLRQREFGSEHRAFAVTASNISVIHYRAGDYGRLSASDAFGGDRSNGVRNHHDHLFGQHTGRTATDAPRWR